MLFYFVSSVIEKLPFFILLALHRSLSRLLVRQIIRTVEFLACIVQHWRVWSIASISRGSRGISYTRKYWKFNLDLFTSFPSPLPIFSRQSFLANHYPRNEEKLIFFNLDFFSKKDILVRKKCIYRFKIDSILMFNKTMILKRLSFLFPCLNQS